jgi:hypothetical protein
MRSKCVRTVWTDIPSRDATCLSDRPTATRPMIARCRRLSRSGSRVGDPCSPSPWPVKRKTTRGFPQPQRCHCTDTSDTGDKALVAVHATPLTPKPINCPPLNPPARLQVDCIKSRLFNTRFQAKSSRSLYVSNRRLSGADTRIGSVGSCVESMSSERPYELPWDWRRLRGITISVEPDSSTHAAVIG